VKKVIAIIILIIMALLLLVGLGCVLYFGAGLSLIDSVLLLIASCIASIAVTGLVVVFAELLSWLIEQL
jgi:hypothetical protein